MKKPQIPIDELKKLYQKSEVARAFLDHAARRKNNQTETKVDRILTILNREGHSLSRGDVIELFKRFEALELGSFVKGTHGWPSRFVWQVGIVSVGKAAAGESAEIESVADEDTDTEDADADLVVHSFRLRDTLVVKLSFPDDLTDTEAERLAGFVKTLPINDD
ncbi:MAG: hypothetical protein QM691_12115 [Opitutaceae bacterium]